MAKVAAYGLPYPHPTSAEVTARMRANRQTDTKPEIQLRSALHRLGFRFRKEYPVRAGGRTRRVDIAFPREKLAVFVDGCFWHSCPEHGTTPAANAAYWIPKLEKNVARDKATTQALEAEGWSVLRLWEHVPCADAAAAVATTVDAIRGACRPTAIDLFAGAGGSTQGMSDAGYRVVAAVENDESAGRSYSSNHPGVALLDDDIQDVSPSEMRTSLGLDRGALGLLVACPPCQGFSTLGLSDEDDPRNDLVSIVQPFVEEFLPSAFLLENVPGLRGDERLAALVEWARSAGYGVRSYVVNATSFGVPQSRRRLIVVGVHGLDEEVFPTDLSDVLPRRFKQPVPNVLDVLMAAGSIEGSADPIHRSRQSSPTVLARIRKIPPGGGRFDLPEEHQLACHKSMEKRNATAAYGRIRLDGPAPTMTTRCTTPACGRFVHPTEDRGISLREAALIQTFPPRYRFYGSHQSLEAQIGNAVPVRMAEALSAVAMTLAEASRNG